MIYNENNKIFLTRGDDAIIHIDIENLINGNSTPYNMAEGDRLVFTLKSNSDFEDSNIFINKAFNTPDIYIDHDDTTLLSYGIYLYDIVLQTSNNKIYTLLLGSFELMKEGGR